jgi:DNA-binding transcriptional LysR family regulator
MTRACGCRPRRLVSMGLRRELTDPLDARDVRAFIAVSESGGFRAAASSTGLSQSAVSRRVAALERRLQLRLLHRSPSSTWLTKEGRVFLPLARQLLQLHCELLEAAADLSEHQADAFRAQPGSRPGTSVGRR